MEIIVPKNFDNIALELHTTFRILKYEDPGKKELSDRTGDPEKYCDDIGIVGGNLIVDAGKEEVIKHLMAQNNSQGGAGLFFNNTNSYVGTGTGTTAAAAGDTNLETAPVWLPMDTGFPKDNGSGSPYTGTIWQGTADADTANQAWEEFGLANGNDPGTTGILFNRRVSNQGTKANPNIWVLQMLVN